MNHDTIAAATHRVRREPAVRVVNAFSVNDPVRCDIAGRISLLHRKGAHMSHGRQYQLRCPRWFGKRTSRGGDTALRPVMEFSGGTVSRLDSYTFGRSELLFCVHGKTRLSKFAVANVHLTHTEYAVPILTVERSLFRASSIPSRSSSALETPFECR